MNKDNFIFFWGGPYSQWHKSDFEINRVTYNTCEQYMMAKKALLFNDIESHDKIMDSFDPREQKELGRGVKGFNRDVWEKECKRFVYDANFAKFTQNPELYDLIMLSGSKEFVEASPNDKIWGIGLSATDPLAWDKATWKGTNWLGETLMVVRSALYREVE